MGDHRQRWIGGLCSKANRQVVWYFCGKGREGGREEVSHLLIRGGEGMRDLPIKSTRR